MNGEYFIKNIVNHDETLKNRVIYIRDGKISDIRKGSPPGTEKSYCYAIPGFIDMHTHGGGGKDIMDNSIDTLDSISRFYLQNGTTSFLASTITASLPQIDSVLITASEFASINKKQADKGIHATFLGIHLEGPWLSMKNLGAHNPDHNKVPDKESLELISKHQDIIKMVTFSYHSPESEKLLKLLVNKGIIPACGHDDSYDERILSGFRKGIKVVTHIYCVSSTVHKRNGKRYMGITEMGLMTDGVTVEVIADGMHTTKYFWDFITHSKQYKDIIIVSDSIRCTGLVASPGTKYKLGDTNVIIDQGVAWLEDRSVYAGSIATMYSSFERIVKQWNVNMNDAVRITSYNQAALLNLSDRLGGIGPGKVADILLLDQDLNLQRVIKSGSEVVI